MSNNNKKDAEKLARKEKRAEKIAIEAIAKARKNEVTRPDAFNKVKNILQQAESKVEPLYSEKTDEEKYFTHKKYLPPETSDDEDIKKIVDSKGRLIDDNLGKGKSNKYSIIAIHFKPSSELTSQQRLKIIRSHNIEPMKRVHKTKTGFQKYRIKDKNPNKSIRTLVRKTHNIIIEY